MNISYFGSDNGRNVIFFYGVPGAPEECAFLDPCGKENNLTFICFNRFAIDLSIKDEAYYQHLADEISRLADGKKVDIIGFSIGAFIALQTCRYLKDQVRTLHLISAAAPLEAGNFLDAMAGKRVFQLAKVYSRLVILLTYWQRLLALLSPNLLFKMLFASAAGGDKTLTADRQFQANITKNCSHVLLTMFKVIRGILALMCSPGQLRFQRFPVRLISGHGAGDNWSPTSMAEYLQSAIPGCVSINILDNLSHYSCLYATAPNICAQLGKTQQ